jgi:HTH-type transcriptional regulator/antitoxin HigA
MEGSIMKTMTGHAKDSYLELVRKFPLVPLKNEAQYDAALSFLKKLAVRDEAALDAGEGAYLEALTRFVEDYEDRHHLIDTSTMGPIDALKFLMAENEMKPADLGRLLGNRSIASQILNGKRGLSQRHIRILADRFKVEAGLFVR